MLKGTQLIGFGGRQAGGAEQDAQWNSADKDADVTLSNSDRTATASAAGSVRSLLGRTSGKYYWECTVATSTGNLRVGLANSTFSLATYPGAAASSAGINSGGNTVSTWTKSQSGTFTINLGDVINFACDITTGYLWVGLNNSWQLTGNPAAGTNPWVSGISGTVHPVTGWAGSTTGTVTIYTKTAELAYSPPSGFSNWAAAS